MVETHFRSSTQASEQQASGDEARTGANGGNTVPRKHDSEEQTSVPRKESSEYL